jgi:hypothetical protein
MIVAKHDQNNDMVEFIKLCQQSCFRIYHCEKIKLAQLYFDSLSYETVDPFYKKKLFWKNGILFTDDNEPLTFACENTILSPVPEWWPAEVVWPPRITLFSRLKKASDVAHKKSNFLRNLTSWNDAFVKTSSSTISRPKCVCGKHTFQAKTHMLKNEYGIPSFYLCGSYDRLFTNNIEKLKHMLNCMYTDQCCLWTKLVFIELRQFMASMYRQLCK